MTQTNQSEVANLMHTIDLQNQAAQYALTAPALGTARHTFINARLEHIATIHQQRKSEVGWEQATSETCAAIDALCDEVATLSNVALLPENVQTFVLTTGKEKGKPSL